MFNRRLLSLLTVAGLVLGLSGIAMAGIPDLTNSTATSAGGRLYISPSGLGETLASKGATISVEVRDANNQPIANFPAQDIWWSDAGLETTYPGLNLCQGGGAADANTNASGQTTLSGTLFGGGTAQNGVQVYINGLPLNGAALAIEVNGPDNTADRVVNLGDVANFAADLLVYDFRSDLVVSVPAVINLSDVGVFASHIGDACP